MPSQYLRQVQLLEGPAQPATRADALLQEGRLVALGAEATERASALGLQPLEAQHWWLAPPLVDPHSCCEDPWQGPEETLASLACSALAAGYGTVALLPQARTHWRDRPEHLALPPLEAPLAALSFPLWGSFSLAGGGDELAPHHDLLAWGALGLAAGSHCPPLGLLERGLQLGEMEQRPVLVAPRDQALAQRGFVREGVEALRSGWPLDSPLSETQPLGPLIALAQQWPERSLRLMNVSTAEGVDLLRAHPAGRRPAASVSWWHLVADSGCLDPLWDGWRVEPSLGRPGDRQALIDGLRQGVLSAVAVHHQPLDPEEQLLPLDQRKPGVAGHTPVLPCLWQELVVGQGWSPQELWQVLCWGPAAFLGLEPPALAIGTSGWILFDPHHSWTPTATDPGASRAANQPLIGQPLRGRVLATGLRDAPGSGHP